MCASRCASLRPGGGFVFQQVHNILADVPPENIVAMFDACGSLICCNRRLLPQGGLCRRHMNVPPCQPKGLPTWKCERGRT